MFRRNIDSRVGKILYFSSPLVKVVVVKSSPARRLIDENKEGRKVNITL